ncbi:hypothetical protein PR003_g25969 [Phytophthora rubi]|uniref:Uncharacterized protein n=1 Tax=Phytophthora rubi TaxID=129364 RepID=A0A6A4CDF3_9STRA|nr:hypothetical protein PR003_g25969 [Phytophthora rubi]
MQVDQDGSREVWPDLWTKLANIWPSRVTMAFPLMTSTEEEWCATAQQEPYNLIYMCQHFKYPEEVLATLGDKVHVLEVWTSGWRKECLYESLVAYRSKTEDPSTCRWLDEWKDKLLRPAPPNLAPLIDNREDWVRLHKRSYGEDDVLRLCDVGHKDQLAHHLLCAFLYEKEIRVLTGREDEADTGPLTRLTRHLRALETGKAYGQAYAGSSRGVDWYAVARFFSAALERGDKERERHN